MTLKSAIESGIPFKRPNWRYNHYQKPSWVEVQGDDDQARIHFIDSGNPWRPYSSDLIATDYILKCDHANAKQIRNTMSAKCPKCKETLKIKLEPS